MVARKRPRGPSRPFAVHFVRHVHLGVPGGRALRGVRPAMHSRRGALGRRRTAGRASPVRFPWYSAQCGSCNSRCPMEIDIMGLISSLRCLAQLKGYHLKSVRGRQQYAGRHLWGGNLWNRGRSLYFRNGDPAAHPDFGPRYPRWNAEVEDQFVRLGAQPDMDGTFAGNKVPPATLGGIALLHPGWGDSVPLGQDRGARCKGRRTPRPRPRPVLRTGENRRVNR